MEDINIIKPEKNQRNQIIDAMKGILIILVVLGHTYNNFTYNFIYLFHVGLFFVLSGYCFSQKYTDSFSSLWELFMKRIKSLWIPYVFYNFVFLLLQNIWLKVGFLTSDETYFSYEPFLKDGYCLPITIIDAVKAIIKSFFFMNSRPFAGGLWFLGGLFYVTFMYVSIQFIMRKLKIEKFHIVISILFLLTGWLIEKVGLIEKLLILKQVAIILISEVLFCIGTYVRQYIHLQNFKALTYCAGFFLFLVIIFILSAFGSVSVASVHIVNPLFYLTAIMSGGGLLICLLRLLNSINANSIISFFSFIGNKTIPILALHPICFKLITVIQWKVYGGDKIVLSMYPVWKNSIPWAMAYLVIGVTIPLLLVFPFSKTKFGKSVLKC